MGNSNSSSRSANASSRSINRNATNDIGRSASADQSRADQSRAEARKQRDLANQYFQQSKQAYSSNNHAEAKKYSQLGKKALTAANDLDGKASMAVYESKNHGVSASADNDGEIDLHGLYVREALALVKSTIIRCYDNPSLFQHGKNLRIIVGRGNHSQNGVAKIRPAVMEELGSMSIQVQTFEIDPRNEGVILVTVRSHSGQSTGAYNGQAHQQAANEEDPLKKIFNGLRRFANYVLRHL